MMPFKRTTQRGRVVERFNNLLLKYEYYDEKIFPKSMFDNEEFNKLLIRRYDFDIARGNRILIESVIPVEILSRQNSTYKSVGRSTNNIGVIDDHNPNFVASEDYSTEKWEKLSKLQTERMDEIVCSEIKKRPRSERDILILHFNKHFAKDAVRKKLGLPRNRVDNVIMGMYQILKDNIPRDLEGFERESGGM